MLSKASAKLIGAACLGREGIRRCTSLLSGRPCLGYVGWLGHDNLGDEAMYQAIQGLLSSSCNLIPYRDGRQENLLRWLGLSGSRFFDMALVGGGTLVNPGFWPPVEALARQGTPLVMFGTGAGSSGFGQTPRVSLAPWSTIAKSFVAVGVRGPLSQQSLYELGFEEVEVIGDPALSLALSNLPTPTRPARVVVNLAGEPARELLVELAGLLAELACEGAELVGAALSFRDIEAFDRFFETEGAPSFPIVTITREPARYIRLVSGASVVVAVRLHAAILACCAGTPSLLFSYRQKCEDFMASMGLTEYLLPWEPVRPGLLRRLWLRVQSEGEGLRKNILERAASWRSAQARFAARILQELQVNSGTAAPGPALD